MAPPTPLQSLLGLDGLHRDLRAFVETVLVIAGLLGAFAVRRRRRAVTPTTFLLLAGSVLIDTGSRFLPNPDVGQKVAVAAFVLFLFGVIRLVLEGVDSIARRGKVHFSTITKDLLMILLWFAVLMAVLYTDFGVSPVSILTTTTVAAAVLGFALQETLGNIFSGLSLSIGRPFEPGDWIRSGQHVGQVKGIAWRATTITTRANERLEIPNSVIAKDVLYNYATGAVREEIAIGLSYGVPPNHVREVVLTLLRDVPQVKIPFPTRTVHVRDAGRDEDERADAQFEHELMGDLRQVDFLRGLNDDELRMLVPSVAVRQFGAGELLMRAGEQGESMFIIRSGTAEVFAHTADGQTRHLANYVRGDFTGEMALMTGEPRTASVRAITDVEVIEMDREGFTQLFKEHPDAAAGIGDIIALRNKDRLEKLSAGDSLNGRGGPHRWLLAKMRELFDIKEH